MKIALKLVETILVIGMLLALSVTLLLALLDIAKYAKGTGGQSFGEALALIAK